MYFKNIDLAGVWLIDLTPEGCDVGGDHSERLDDGGSDDKLATHDEGTMWWIRGLRRRDHTIKGTQDTKDWFGDKVMSNLFAMFFNGGFTREWSYKGLK